LRSLCNAHDQKTKGLEQWGQDGSIEILVNSGERVVAVVGASHVIRQEPVLHKLLESDSISSN